MNGAPSIVPRTNGIESLEPGLGVPCREAQCDGVPCPQPDSDCAVCGRAHSTSEPQPPKQQGDGDA